MRPGQLEGINHLPCSNDNDRHHLVARKLFCSGSTINGVITMKEDKLIKSAFMGLQHIRHLVWPLRNLHIQKFVLKSLLGIDMAGELLKGLLLGKAHEPETPFTSTTSDDEMFDDEEVLDEQNAQDREQQESGIEETPRGEEEYQELEASDEQQELPHKQQGFVGVVTHDEAKEFGFEF